MSGVLVTIITDFSDDEQRGSRREYSNDLDGAIDAARTFLLVFFPASRAH